MAGKSISRTESSWISLGVASAIAAASLGLASCTQPDSGPTVQQAYELRMHGKADSAKALLEQMLSEDSANSLAHYELARTKFQIALAEPRQLLDNLSDSQNSIERAVEHEPDNVIYRFFAGRIAFFQAYASLHMNRPGAKDDVAKACSTYESVLELQPDYREASLYLVELYATVPEDMGGDVSKAEGYAAQLEGMDEIFGAKARSLLLPDEVDRVDYWQRVLDAQPGNAEVLVELGRASLFRDEGEDGARYFEEAVRIDPEKSILFLDLARYHTMTVMRDEGLKDTALPLAEQAITRFLDSDPILPLRAFALGLLARVKGGMGDNERYAQLVEEANTADPFFSKAFGVPTPDLFVPPGEVSHNHRYLFRPF
jgi:tetratricopeptide (TPR) repeat protein